MGRPRQSSIRMFGKEDGQNEYRCCSSVGFYLMSARPLVLGLLFLLGCPSNARPVQTEEELASGNESVTPPEVEASGDPVGENSEVAEPEPASCQQEFPGGCIARGDCIFEQGAGCRELRNDCERWWTDRSQPAPTECPDGCALRRAVPFGEETTSRYPMVLCVPYEQVTECPATLEESIASVDCPLQQVVLECDYEDAEGPITMACRRPDQGCPGGRRRPREFRSWRGLRPLTDYDENGCPQTDRAQAARCREPRSLQCSSCTEVTQCVRGRWRVTRRIPRQP